MEKTGIGRKDGSKETFGKKSKRWLRQFSFAEMEKEDIESHAKQLANAMDQFMVRGQHPSLVVSHCTSQLTLETFTGFTVHAIKSSVDSIGSDLRVIGDNLNEIMAVQGSGERSPALPSGFTILISLRKQGQDQNAPDHGTRRST